MWCQCFVPRDTFLYIVVCRYDLFRPSQPYLHMCIISYMPVCVRASVSRVCLYRVKSTGRSRTIISTPTLLALTSSSQSTCRWDLHEHSSIIWFTCGSFSCGSHCPSNAHWWIVGKNSFSPKLSLLASSDKLNSSQISRSISSFLYDLHSLFLRLAWFLKTITANYQKYQLSLSVLPTAPISCWHRP